MEKQCQRTNEKEKERNIEKNDEIIIKKERKKEGRKIEAAFQIGVRHSRQSR